MTANIVQLIKSRESGIKNRKFPRFKPEKNTDYDFYPTFTNSQFLNFIRYKCSNLTPGTMEGSRMTVQEPIDYNPIFALLYHPSSIYPDLFSKHQGIFYRWKKKLPLPPDEIFPPLDQCYLYVRLTTKSPPIKYTDILLGYYPFDCNTNKQQIRHMGETTRHYPISPDFGYVNYQLFEQEYEVAFRIEYSTNYKLLNVE